MPQRRARRRPWFRWPAAESVAAASLFWASCRDSTQDHEAVRETGAAGFPIEVDGLGPRDDRLPVAVLVQIGQRGQEQLAAEAPTAKVGCDAGGAEEAEAAVVRVVSREAGDLPLMLHREEGGAVRRLESPDGSECSVDEVENRFPRPALRAPRFAKLLA